MNFLLWKLSTNKLIKNETTKKRILVEKQIFQKIDNPFIVKLHYSFQTVDKFFFVLDLVNGGELANYMMEKFYLKHATRFYAAEMLWAIKCLHDNDIIYRDLKPSNILIDLRGHIKIIDFGLSTFDDSGTRSVWGTPNYIAPEMLKDKSYDKTLDYWSFGWILYEMASGYPPFKSNNTRNLMKIYQNIINTKVKYPSKRFSEPLKDLIKKLLEKDPKKRLGSKGTQEIMDHEYFSDINWNDVENMKLKPPYVPRIRSVADVHFIDENMYSSVDEHDESTIPSHNRASEYRHIENFTFINKSSMGQASWDHNEKDDLA